MQNMKESEGSDMAKSYARTQWSNKFDFIVTLLGYSIGLADVWRLPYLTYRNGGGAFIIPYTLFILLCGMPLYFFEIAMTQYSGKGPWKFWDICPIFRGFAVAIVIVNLLSFVNDGTVRLWILEYLINSFRGELPWTTCDNWWNTPACISLHHPSFYRDITLNVSSINMSDVNLTTTTAIKLNPVYATEEFWRHKVLQQSTGIDDVGEINGIYVLYHAVIRLLVFLACIKSIQSIGKMMYISALLPILLTIIILIRALLLPGSTDGMLYCLTPDFTRLKDVKVWIEAGFMAFYTLGPGWGGLMMMGCHNHFKTNCLRSSVLTTVSTLLFGLLNNLVVFSVVGVMANSANIPINEIISSGGFSIGFIAYPMALSYFPFPQIWCVIFYVTLLLPGIDALTIELEPVILVLEENFSNIVNNKRPHVLGVLSVVTFLVGLPFTTTAAIYIYQIMDWYVAPFSVVFICLLESVMFSWIYGTHRIDRDMMVMLGRRIPAIIRISCAFIMPIFLMILLVVSLHSYRPPTLGTYTYPVYANTIGWIITVSSIVPMFLYAIVTVARGSGTLRQRLDQAFRYNSEWKPISKDAQLVFDKTEKFSAIGWKQLFIYNLIGKGIPHNYSLTHEAETTEMVDT